jgi:hypothetical protein
MNWKYFRYGLILSALVTLSPLAMVLISWAGAGFSGSPLSEGPDGHGAYIWMFFFTIPAGGLGFFLSIVVSFISARLNKSKDR